MSDNIKNTESSFDQMKKDIETILGLTEILAKIVLQTLPMEMLMKGCPKTLVILCLMFILI